MNVTARRLGVHRLGRALIVVVGLLPWMLPLAARGFGMDGIGELVRRPYALVCHQRPERTLVLLGATMPVCSRCAGLFAGAACGAFTAFPVLELRTARLALLVGTLLMLLDIALVDSGVHPSWHATRLATGGLVGYLGAVTFTSLLARESRSDVRD